MAENNASGTAPERSRRWVLIILVVAAALYAAGINSHWRFQRDSAVYMDLARSMLERRGYVSNYEPHTKYTPGFPLMLAACGAVSGVPETLSDSFLCFNLLESLLGLGCIALFYLVLRELALPRAVEMAAFLFFAFSRTLYYYSTHVMTDVPFTFFALGALWLGLKMVKEAAWRSWAAGAGAAIMILVASSIRPVGPLLVVAVTAGLWLRRGALRRWKGNLGKTVLLVSLLAASLLAYSIWMHSAGSEEGSGGAYFRNKVAAHRFARLATVLVTEFGKHMEGISDVLLGTQVGTAAGAILTLVMLVGLAQSLKRGERQLSVFAALVIGVILAGGWALRRRYLLPAAPVMYLWLALGGATIGSWLGRRWKFWTPRRTRRLGYVLICLVLAVNVMRIGKVIYQNRRPDFYAQTADSRLSDYGEICAWLRDNADREDAVLAYESSTVHYFSRVRTVHLPCDTRRRKMAWLEQLIDRRKARFVVLDSRKPESTAVAQKAIEQHPEAFRQVLKPGKTKLLRVSAAGLSPGGVPKE
ncbi:MAG: glycosyltransferase family 39 protein [Planctomycetes bacterium]|nr:glycosyltransferase family 39 protein [Planctomycetota bacterium]